MPDRAAFDVRTPRDGRPFYCIQCGAGFGEFMACEDVICELESVQAAIARKSEHDGEE